MEEAIEKLKIEENLSLIAWLPPEILLQIFEKCQVMDLLSVARVCHVFRVLTYQILQKRYPDFMVHGIAHFALFLKLNSRVNVWSTTDVLRTLHISDVEKFFTLVHISKLRLTALTADPVFLRNIVMLPRLKCLQFYWLGAKPPLQFMENLFQELIKNPLKSECLRCMIFKNCRFDTSAKKRENVGTSQQQPLQSTDELMEKISKVLERFIHLETLSFRNCRPLNYDQIKKLSEINKNLKVIKICGCTDKEYQQLLEQWRAGERLRDGVQFKIESVPRLNTAKNDEAADNLVGSIEFHFINES